MKKTLAIFLALGLSACATMNNPLTLNTVASIESAYGVALSAAVAYHDLCAKRQIPASCRNVVVQLQAADRKTQGALAAVRALAAAGPTVDATSAIAAAQAALAQFQAVETAYGVK